MANSKTGAENIYDEEPGHLLVSKSKEVQKTNKENPNPPKNQNSTRMRVYQRDTRANGKISQWPNLKQFQQQN